MVIFPPRGKGASLDDFALPERVTLLRALRALRASFVVSVRALGRGESAQFKYLNCNDYIITYRFPSPVGCMSPPLPPIAPEETPLPDRAPERSPLRAARSAARPAQVRPLPVGSCRDNPPRGKLHREARTGKAHPGYALTGQTTSGRPPRGFSDSLRRELRRARRPAPFPTRTAGYAPLNAGGNNLSTSSTLSTLTASPRHSRSSTVVIWYNSSQVRLGLHRTRFTASRASPLGDPACLACSFRACLERKRLHVAPEPPPTR